MREDNEQLSEEEIVTNVVKESLQTKQDAALSSPGPDQVFVIPLTRRPFFPGMAAPVVIEPGPFYEVLKLVAKTEHKCMGLFLTKEEDANVYKVGFKDFYKVGVLARILRIIPM
ncbi:MAG: LON peptidase substrate-binding domain-containing protein, partial [Pyrinomonadaceae bacterium]